MAVFLLRAEHGASYAPPPATGIFADLVITDTFTPWIEQLSEEGVTAGCGGRELLPQPPEHARSDGGVPHADVWSPVGAQPTVLMDRFSGTPRP